MPPPVSLTSIRISSSARPPTTVTLPPARGVFEGVAEQVGEHLGQPVAVTLDGDRRPGSRCSQRDPRSRATGATASTAARTIAPRSSVARSSASWPSSARETSDRSSTSRCSRPVASCRTRGSRRRPRRPVGQPLVVGLDRRERGPQLVGEVGQEPAAGVLGVLEGVGHALNASVRSASSSSAGGAGGAFREAARRERAGGA
jgi:hypothetical protein